MQQLASVAVMALHRYFKISSKLPGSQCSFIEYSATRGDIGCEKIVKQASDKGGILKAQQRKYSVSVCCFFKFQRGGWDFLVDMILLHCSRSPS